MSEIKDDAPHIPRKCKFEEPQIPIAKRSRKLKKKGNQSFFLPFQGRGRQE